MSTFDPQVIDNPMLRAAFSTLQSEYPESKESLFRYIGMDGEIKPEPSIPTGSVALDKAIGIGGIPKGRLTIISGEYSTGKTTLCLGIIKNQVLIDPKKTNLYFDFETGAFTESYVQNMGEMLGPNQLIISEPDYLQQAMEIAYRLISTGQIGVCVFDSIAGAYTKEASEKSAEKSNSIAGVPRVLSDNLGKLCSKCGKTGTALVFVNQLRTQMGNTFSWIDISGGKTQKFMASLWIELEQKDKIKKYDGSQNQARIVAKIKKNKVGNPFGSAEFDIMFGVGIIKESSILDQAIDSGIIQQAGAGWFTLFDITTGEEIVKLQGRPVVLQYLRDNPDYCDEIEQSILGYERDTTYQQEVELGEDSLGIEDKLEKEVEKVEEKEIKLEAKE